ncbi:YHS domain-containing (seleno)protein [Arenimonas sp. MALMAid1274]|uniref:YHS domain-containing (seleno)protein n=1 Tax=Arenimonas sp. MALMAid1274 TaxID=3411630 RepID=UPI003BA03AC0
MRPLTLILLAVLVVLIAPRVMAVDEVFATPEGAIRGYDPVAYHTEAKAVPGKPGITLDWNGATWRFASEANRDLFAAQPERYAPQYGGYCAYGTSQGYKVSTQPEAFAIVDGKLYLNYNVPVQRTWNRDRPGYIAKADRNWVQLESTPHTKD